MANNLDAFIPEIWSRRIIQRIDQVNVAMSIVANTDYEGEIREQGDTVQVRRYGDVTIQSYTRGQTISYQDLVPTKEPMTINEARQFAFSVDDIDKAQNDLSAIDGYIDRAAVALSNDIDRKLLSYTTSALAANQITNSGSAINITASTAGTAVYELIVNAGLALDIQDVPSDRRWIIVTPYFKSLLLKDTTYFIKGSTLGDTILQTGRPDRTAAQAAANGYVGQIAGFDVWQSNHLLSNAGNYYCPFGQGKPISYASQIPAGHPQVLTLESTFATAARGLMLHDGKVFSEDAKRLGYIYVDNS